MGNNSSTKCYSSTSSVVCPTSIHLYAMELRWTSYLGLDAAEPRNTVSSSAAVFSMRFRLHRMQGVLRLESSVTDRLCTLVHFSSLLLLLPILSC